MIQKVLQVGSSAAVTIPHEVMREFGWRVGDRITVVADAKRQAITIELPKTAKVDEVRGWTKKFITHYHSALKELAKK